MGFCYQEKPLQWINPLGYFCGIKPGYDGFSISPCLPTEWDHVRVHRLLRGKSYEIRIERESDGYQIEVNGKPYLGPLAY